MANNGNTEPGQVALTIDEALEIGLNLHRNGQLTQAEMLYGRLIEAAPENLNALHYLGLLCHQQNRSNEAVELIKRIITLAPENADAHNNLGNVLEGIGKAGQAEECYRKAISLFPDHGPALNNLGVVLMARNKVAEAVETYQNAIRVAPYSADFHYNLGNALVKSGDADGAIASYQRAITLKPDYALAWQRLAMTFISADRKKEAEAVFEKWLTVDPGNPTVLYLQAACLGNAPPDRAPNQYVQQVFDDMADSFDTHLVERLEYRAPDLLMEALAQALPQPAAVLAILDAGCGTGLCGPPLRPYAGELTGVDLSPGMLAKAKGRNVYDNLETAELTEFLDQHDHAFDVIFSADTLCYFGTLAHVFDASANALKPDGLFAFTLEEAEKTDVNPRLNSHGRYSHPRSYATKTLADAGFDVVSMASKVLRKEEGRPVSGFVVVARKKQR
ncbi:MAG: tetratricopeptide repeat protein [Desulfobacteraceae bacterium]|nr:tetratricopeptide repeat protein [Desulfobacteraceae bacterium]